MLSNIGTVEIVVIAVVLLVLFAGDKLPMLVRSISEAGKELKKAGKELDQTPKNKK